MLARPPLLTVLMLAITAIATTTSPSVAQWIPSGDAICVAPCDQAVTSTLSDGNGGMYLAWEDNRSCANTIAYIQHIDRHGAIASGWPALGRPVCSSTVGQVTPSLVADGQGGAIVIWKDYRLLQSVFAERFTPTGTPLWDPSGVAVCDAGAIEDGPSALSDGEGGVFVAWEDQRLGLHRGAPSHDLLFNHFAQHIVASGARVWGAMGAQVSGDVVYQPPSVLSSDDTGTLITWNDGTRMQRLDASGAPLLGTDGISVAVPAGYLVVPDGAGGVLEAFAVPAADGGSAVLRAQQTDGTGALLWGADGGQVSFVESASGLDQRPWALIADGSGGAYVAWTDRTGSGDRDIFLQHLGPTGVPAAGWPANGIDVSPAIGAQTNPQLLADGSGGCFMSWDDARNPATGSDIFAQRVTSTGAIAPGWTAGGTIVCSVAGDQNESILTSDGAGGALVAWRDRRSDGDVYAQRIQSNGTMGDSPVLGVEPPSTVSFGISALFPNPWNAATLHVSLSLPNGAPARLALIDAQGRLVSRDEVRLAGGGRTTIALSRPQRLPPGIYVLRLEQSGRTVSRSVSMVR
jgi:hypothetical protein